MAGIDQRDTSTAVGDAAIETAIRPDGMLHRLVATTRVTTRSLRYRNFRLYFIGQGVSLIGTWMQRVAMAWLVYRLTGSALLLGVVGFASRIPTLVLAPLAGVAADRWDRRRILYATQSLSMLQAILMAALVLGHVIAVWHVMVLAVFLGIMSAFDIPARQSFFVHLIDDARDLGNAIALNSTVFNIARLIGPAIAGVLIAFLGEGPVFALNAVTFLAMLAALRMMRLRPEGPRGQTHRVLQNMREGFHFAWGFTPVRAVLVLITVVSIMAVPFTVLMPVFATNVLHGGPDTLGFLTASQGVGALVGALFLAQRESVRGLGRVIAVAAVIFGAGLVAFGSSRALPLSMLLLAVAGFGLMVQTASSNTFLQTAVTDDMRGRIMSFYTMAFSGTMPIGSLFAGVAADHIGAPATVVIGGTATIVAALLFAWKLPALRRQFRAREVARMIPEPDV
ncbi:MAG: MFS transporter [Gemmatimonadota bacterium]